MLNTPKRGLQKPELVDGPAALRTAIGANADTLDGALGSRGKTNIATAESRTNVAYGLLTTPDQVSGIVLPTDGLIVIAYQATWQNSATGAAQAAIFLSANQAAVAASTSASPSAANATASGPASTATDKALSSHAGGLFSWPLGATAYTGDLTTGQVVGVSNGSYPDLVGGPCYIFAAAATYTVSIQFRSTSGSVTVKNRKLWVWVETF